MSTLHSMSTLHRQFPQYVFARRTGQSETGRAQQPVPAPRRSGPTPRAEQQATASGVTPDVETSAVLGYN
jgi:hypothetical protein